MKKIIHIPHLSKFIPNDFLDDYIISQEQLDILNEMYHDKYVDELVYGINDVDILKFEYSRLFCDVERFNDESEEMNKYGRGILYTHDHNFNLIRKVNNKDSIISLYNDHHNKLTFLVDNHLKYSDVLIIDLHSYSDELLSHIDNVEKLPDLCIGVDDFHFNSDIFNKVLKIIETENIIYNINYPYSGSIVPIKHYNKNKNVISVMLDFKKKFLKNNIEKIKEIIKCITEI